MNRSIFSNFPWSLVAILVSINLIRPLLSIAGLYDGIKPAGPAVMTVIIAILWVGIAVIKRIEYPIVVQKCDEPIRYLHRGWRQSCND